MNCERFQMVAEDLARNDGPQEGNPRGLMVIDTSERAGALAHVAGCEQCAQILTAQNELSESLHSLAEEMQVLQAPPHLEAQLLAAHRSQTRSLAIQSSQPPRLYWITAVAALLLLVLGLMVWRVRPNSEPPVSTAGKSNSVLEPAAGSPGARQSLLVPVGVNPTAPPSANGAPDQRDTQPKRVNHKASRFGRRFAAAAQLAKHKREERAIKEQANALAANAEPAEVATDFVPVGYVSALDLQEGGQLVRVELPRLALASFGLPVNMDRVDERVKADVLVGPDGLARAIRFVK
ncbi:MAG: hypothetical protein ABI596_15910 [Pyrinomonadaceae bacterium]